MGARMDRDFTIIGAATIDVLAGPADARVFESGSQPVGTTRLSFGGDALNEAAALARLGKRAGLVSKVGKDEAGARILAYLRENGLPEEGISVVPGLETAVNIVLFDGKGERHFLTNPNGSLRKLAVPDVEPYLDDCAAIVSFASMFVSPLLGIPEMEYLFRRIKEKENRTLVADMTKAKRGERLDDLRELLPYVDFILPNEEEAALLTGERDPYVNAGLFVDAGASCAVVKCGGRGCIIRTAGEAIRILAYPDARCVDTTGAGDCFAAGFLWGLSEKMSLADCGRMACAAASCSVECIGATEGIVSAGEMLERYGKIRAFPI